MSVYAPDLRDIGIARLADGWYVMDKFGPLWGPFEEARDARAAIENETQSTGFIGCRHPSYAER